MNFAREGEPQSFEGSRQVATPEATRFAVPSGNDGITTTHLAAFSTASGIALGVREILSRAAVACFSGGEEVACRFHRGEHAVETAKTNTNAIYDAAPGKVLTMLNFRFSPERARWLHLPLMFERWES